MNSLWIQYLFHEFTMNALSVSRMQVNLHFSRVFAVCYVNSYSIILNPLSIWLIHMKSSFRGCTLNSKSGSHIHLESTDRFSESLWIHYLLRGLSGNSLSLREITMNSLFTFCFANWLWINYLYQLSLLISQKHSEFISWWFRVKKWIQGEFAKEIVNSYWNHEADSEFKVNSGKNSEFKEKSRSR